MQSMSIGQLAKASAVTIDTVRFYERQGLLVKPKRRASGYRQYAADDARRLKFIRRAKALGFTLSDIAELLKLKTQTNQTERSIDRVRQVARKNLQAVEAKLQELERMRDVLKQLVDACPGGSDIDHCPILRSFDDNESDDMMQPSGHLIGARSFPGSQHDCKSGVKR